MRDQQAQVRARARRVHRLVRGLFGKRRWMLWLPIPIAALFADGSGEFLPMLVGGLILWVPFWLAWWLSDGFRGMSQWPSGGPPQATGGINPATGKPCVVYRHPWGGTIYVGGE